MKARDITAEANRGILLDVVVFVINLILMNHLTGYFIDLVRLVGEGDPFARFSLGLCLLGALVLPAAGAVLKRWHFHWRLKSRGNAKWKRKARRFDPLDLQASGVSGCLFHPVFYFALSVVISSGVMAFLGEALFGENARGKGGIFVSLVILSIVLSVIQTALVYRYFSPPKKVPEGEFWRGPQSELVGDLCLFVNVILFQVFWNLIIVQIHFSRVTSVGEFAGRLFWLSFITLLLYFPPRIFYLAEDINRRATWLTMLFANSPTILRVLFGENLESNFG
ncbi:MAG: hypothetical protein ACRD9R_05695 [Pyrinomonadaceae bacterium]